ncbi:MAG: hypothetical protein JEY91_05690 [Spirochaetaceae bacterium]|nr:hypothetical protein [Spirochaetaceae bacterium]
MRIFVMRPVKKISLIALIIISLIALAAMMIFFSQNQSSPVEQVEQTKGIGEQQPLEYTEPQVEESDAPVVISEARDSMSPVVDVQEDESPQIEEYREESKEKTVERETGALESDKVVEESPEDIPLFAYTDVGPIEIVDSTVLNYQAPIVILKPEEPVVHSQLIYESFTLEPETLQPFSEELIDEILKKLPHIYLEEQIVVTNEEITISEDEKGKREDITELTERPPVIKIVSPRNDSFYNSRIIISGSVLNEPGSHLANKIENFYWTMAGSDRKNDIEFSEMGLFEFQISAVDVNHDLHIVFTAIKEGSLRNDYQLTLKNDRTGPEITLYEPVEDQYYGSQIIVAGNVSDITDKGNEVKSLYWSVSTDEYQRENLVFFEDDGSFEFKIDSQEMNGLLSLKLTAMDLNNNQSDCRLNLKDGKKTPLILLEFPRQGTTYGIGIPLRGKVTDPYAGNREYGGIESIIAQIKPADSFGEGETEIITFPIEESGVFDYTFPADQRKGEQKLTILAVARNGNKAETSVVVSQSEFPISDVTVRPGDRQVILDWSTSPFISRYFLSYTDDGSDPGPHSPFILSDVQPPLHLSKLENGKLYSFLLTGELGDRVVQSDYIRSIPLSEDTMEPYAKNEFGYIEVSWLPIEGSRAYRVLRSEDNLEYFDLCGDISDTRYKDRSCLFGKSYYYKIIPSGYPQIESLSVSGELLSEPPRRLTQKGSIENLSPHAVAIVGDYAFVLSREEGLYIVDINDPAQMSIRGFLLVEKGEDLTVTGEYIIIAARDNGFFVVNVSEPSNPRLVGTRKTSDAVAVASDKEFVYIADGEKGLKFFSLDNPLRPSRIYSNDSFSAYGVTLSDHYLYVSSGQQGLQIFNISRPEYPELVGSYRGINIYESRISGNYFYSASGPEGLNILDISDRENPVFCSNYKTVNAQSLMLNGNHILIADGEGGLIDLDITDPYRPESFEQMNLTNASSVDVKGDIVLVADRSGLYSVESFQYGQSFKIGEIKTDGNAASVTIEGDRAFIADHSGGIVVLQIDDPAGMGIENIIDHIPSSYAEEIVIDENRLYLADGRGGIKIYTLHDDRYVLRESIEIEGDAKSLWIGGEYILSAAGKGGIQGKMKYPDRESSPAYADQIPLEAVDDKILRYKADISLLLPDTRDLIYSDGYIYAADRKKGLVLIDFSRPPDGSVLLEIPLPGAMAIDKNNERLYVAHGRGISIFDMSDRNYPDELALIESPYVEDLKVTGTLLYVAEGHAGLSVYNVKDCSRILKVSQCEDVFADSITVSNDYAYIADSTGMNVVRIYIPQWIRHRF